MLSRRSFVQASLATGASLALPVRAQGPLDLAIARWTPGAPVDTVDKLAARLVEASVDALGGMGRFVSRGAVVWVKPNIGWNRKPELAATTNPGVVATVVRLCKEAGAAKVFAGDNTCHDARQSYATSGIASAAQGAGAEVVYFDDTRYKDMKVGGDRLTNWPIWPGIVEADVVVNVPIAKHHGLADLTLGMKNLMGVAGGSRRVWHQALPDCLAEVTAFVKPRLTVLDAVRVLTGNGPQGGNAEDVVRKDTVVASTDIVALDAAGAELMGFEPGALATIRKGEAAGLGRMDYRALAWKELSVS